MKKSKSIKTESEFFCSTIFTNGNITPRFNSQPYSINKLLNDLAEIKKLSKQDLHHWLTEDYTNFSVLSVSAKHIQSINKLTVTLSKNSAQSFYLNKPKTKQECQCLATGQVKTKPNGTYFFCSTNCSIKTWLAPVDNCLTNSQDCLYFNLFNSKEKKLYTRFLDKVEANFEGEHLNEPNTPAPEPQPNEPSKNPLKPTFPDSNKPKQWLETNSNLTSPSPSIRLDARPHLFITLIFNTSDQDYYAWTISYNPQDPHLK